MTLRSGPSSILENTKPTHLCSLAEWSASHIKAVFESASDEESSHAIAATFATDIDATVNGKQVGLAEIKQMVRTLRGCGKSALRVRWLPGSMVEVPLDESARAGTFAGVYAISGVKRTISSGDNGEPCEVQLERRKVVIVRIQSTSEDPAYDSRRIVALDFAASDTEILQRGRSFL
ncbi:hypothetical protein D9619_004092 [Psilocybe cf. subviscida]|uniref:Uncharacterized protein n=1 Tax=Psilocybe cf. subviscida TaxID=2480587 RepID=A0A8H5F801_9AGAR|nr:hypothetical protein D9619_004092 [Psilocybe cf. subviscida]